jgi:hypothetical protein
MSHPSWHTAPVRRKIEFVELVRRRCRETASPVARARAQMAVTLALMVRDESLPDDLPGAAERLVRLVARTRREVPAA